MVFVYSINFLNKILSKWTCSYAILHTNADTLKWLEDELIKKNFNFTEPMFLFSKFWNKIKSSLLNKNKSSVYANQFETAYSLLF